MLNEADTRTRFIPLKRQLAGREQVPHSIGKQCVFTNGRIMVFGNRAMQTILQKQQPLLLLPSILDKGFRGEL